MKSYKPLKFYSRLKKTVPRYIKTRARYAVSQVFKKKFRPSSSSEKDYGKRLANSIGVAKYAVRKAISKGVANYKRFRKTKF